MATEANIITMNVSLPKPLKRFVDNRVSSGLYGSASEYVREAIREKLERDQAKAFLADKLVEGLESGKPTVVTDDYFKRKKQSLLKRAAGK